MIQEFLAYYACIIDMCSYVIATFFMFPAEQVKSHDPCFMILLSYYWQLEYLDQLWACFMVQDISLPFFKKKNLYYRYYDTL